MFKSALLDFDGTIVHQDILDILADLNGNKSKSEILNAEFHQGKRPGISCLIERVNLISGISLGQINDVIDNNDFLMPGAHEFFRFLKEQNVITIVASGAIMPVLHRYQQILGFDHIIGTSVSIVDGYINGVDPLRPPVEGFKLIECMKLLTKLEIPISNTLAIGDSPAEKGLFLHSGMSIAINPVGGIEHYADHVIGSDNRFKRAPRNFHKWVA